MIDLVFSRDAAWASTLSNDEMFPYHDIMLPGNIEPLRYHVTLHPNVTHSFDYTGTVKVCFRVKKETNDIVLHSLDITHYDTGLLISLGTGQNLPGT